MQVIIIKYTKLIEHRYINTLKLSWYWKFDNSFGDLFSLRKGLICCKACDSKGSPPTYTSIFSVPYLISFRTIFEVKNYDMKVYNYVNRKRDKMANITPVQYFCGELLVIDLANLALYFCGSK